MSSTVRDGSADRSTPEALAQLSTMLAAGEPVDAVLLRVAQLLKECVGDVGDVSISVVDDLGARTVVFTGASAVTLDEVQYELGYGPCLDAARGKRTVLVDTQSDTTYPEFGQQAYRAGIRHSVSIGLTTGDGAAAGINVYVTADQQLDDAAMTQAMVLANYASVAVSRLAQIEGAPTAEWQAAVSSRALVDRAVLVLMARGNCGRQEALQALLTTAQSRGRGVADTANSVISG